MAGPERLAPTPFFDRLVSLEPDDPAEEQQLAALDYVGLVDSLAREVTRLVSSRVRLTEEWRPPFRSALDYGVRDFTGLDPWSPTDRHDIAASLEEAIAKFEPRLQHVRATVEPPGEYQKHVLIRVDADVVIGELREPIAFELQNEGSAIPTEAGHV